MGVITMQNQSLHFTKMHGLGNDFVVVNAIAQPIDLQRINIANLADRHTGIGFDQLLIIQASPAADFFCRIFNADGSEAEQCGNGLRCVARFISEEGLHAHASFQVETKAGIFPLHIQDYDHIRVGLGIPNINDNLHELRIKHDPGKAQVSILSLGNPHAILKVEALDLIPTTQLGQEISTHSAFPQGANVGFMQIVNQHHIRLLTFERGVGETHACGSNACAAAVAGIANGWLQPRVKVEFRHGSLSIDWEGKHHPVYMTGPATKVFSGDILIDVACL